MQLGLKAQPVAFRPFGGRELFWSNAKMILEHDTIDCFLGLFLHKNREMEIQKKRLKDGGEGQKGDHT